MANKSFDVQYVIKLRDAFSTVAKKAARSTENLDRKLRRVSKTYLGFRVALAKAAKATRRFTAENFKLSASMKSLAIQAVAYLGITKAIATGAAFEDAMADTAAITGATGKDLQFLKEKTIEMAKASRTSMVEVSEGMKLVASAKPELLSNVKALAETTKQVLLLKTASGIELSTAATFTAQSLNIFGKEASEAARYVNILAAGSKFGSSEVKDTGEAVVIAGGAARNAGLTFLQLNAAIQTMAKAGFKGSQAGTALNSMLSRLQRQGIDFSKLGLEGGFTVIKKKMDLLTDSTQRAKFASKLFGEEHAKVGFGILNNVTSLGMFERKLLGTSVAEEQSNIRLATFNTNLRLMGIVINSKLVRAFDSLSPSVNTAMESITRLIESFDPEGIRIFFKIFEVGMIVVNGLINGIMLIITLIKGAIQTFAQLVAAIVSFEFGEFTLKDNFSMGGKPLGLSDMRGDFEHLFSNSDTVAPGSTAETSGKADVNINVGLEDGLIQKSPATVKKSGPRPPNVGSNLAGETG